MAQTDRDYRLLKEELDCLRKKFRNTVSTAGGYVDGSLTAPGSSLYPNSYYENCDCASVETIVPDPLDVCPAGVDSGEESSLGDLAENVRIGGAFAFDALAGVFYKAPGESIWNSRNTGLSNTTLNHGVLDYWWYRKTTPKEENVILWTCGNGYIRKTKNAGINNWTSITPSNSSNVKFIQVESDPFNQNHFYVLGTTGNNTVIYKTTNDGTGWTSVDITNYNSAVIRKPIWMSVSSSNIWITTWTDNKLALLKLSNSGTPAVTNEYNLGTTYEIDMYKKIFIAMPKCSLDDPNTVYVYGRINYSLGLAHIMKTINGGSDWTIVENSFGADWVGSLKIGIDNQISYIRNTA